MFFCGKGGHQHALSYDAKVCYGLVYGNTPATPAPALPVPMVSTAQLSYIEALGGDAVHASKLTRKEASRYIDELKARPKMEVARKVEEPKVDPRLAMLNGMLPMIPDGYYAVQKEEGAHVTFMRISTPKGKQQYIGARKVQTQHGPMLDTAAAIYPSGKWYIIKHTVVEELMLLVTDYKGAAMRYSRKIGKCCRCNLELTDTRSRKYGIGPICEPHMPWVIEYVDSLTSV